MPAYLYMLPVITAATLLHDGRRRRQINLATCSAVPMPTSAATHRDNADYQRIDRFVRDHNIKSRSSFLADAALEKLGRA